MDQQTLGNTYPTIITPDMDGDSSSLSSGDRTSTLRRAAHSDSRIHIPHFMDAHGFHTNLTSLFENVSGFNGHHQPSPLINAPDNMDNHSRSTERRVSLTKSDRNKSAFELCSNSVNEEPAAALRKASSVSNYDNIDSHSGSLSRQGSSSFLSNAFHFVTGSSGHNSSLAVQKIPEEEDGGLKMMVTGSSFSPSALTSSSGLHADPILHNNPAHLASNNLADINSLTEKNKAKSGGMFGMFNRGFFAKPVLDDRESSYRYLLAAEKF